MTITTAKLTRAAGLSAVAAGLLFIFVQFIHPEEDVSAVTGSAWATTHYLTMAMAVLALVGVSGIYLRQVREAGPLGLAGFALFGLFFVLTIAFTFVEAFILPALAEEAPAFVNDFLGIFGGVASDGSLGAVESAAPVSGVLYLLGGLLFGAALFRARILARWAAALLAAGTVSTLLIPLLPDALGRMAAIPVGVALAGLGFSLWRERRTAAADPTTGTGDSRRESAGSR